MNKKVVGVILGVFGLVLAGAAYVFRPPNNFSEAIMMASQGRELYLQPPIYMGVLIMSALLVAGGVWQVVRHSKEG